MDAEPLRATTMSEGTDTLPACRDTRSGIFSDGDGSMSHPDLSHAAWRKSSFSSGAVSNCVEVAALDGGRVVAVRDSKDPSGPALVFTPAEWVAFLEGVRAGEFG
jgi:Domain of unknown function (DUF397)